VTRDRVQWQRDSVLFPEGFEFSYTAGPLQ